jgi:hypothetical protein
MLARTSKGNAVITTEVIKTSRQDKREGKYRDNWHSVTEEATD